MARRRCRSPSSTSLSRHSDLIDRTSRAEELPELVGEQGVAIVDEVALAHEEPIDVVGEVAGDLLHPGAVRLADDACDLDASRLDVDDEENEVADQATEREHLDGEEVRRRDRAQMGLQEGGPWHPTAAQGRGFETVLAEDALDRVAGEDVSKVAQDNHGSACSPRSGSRWRTGRRAPEATTPYQGDQLRGEQCRRTWRRRVHGTSAGSCRASRARRARPARGGPALGPSPRG